MGVAFPKKSRGHTEAAHKVSSHSESGGRSWPQPPTKAIAHPSISAFSAGGLWDGGFRRPVFGRGRARSLFLAHKGRTQNLGPFRVRRTNLAPAPHQGYSLPSFWAFSAGGLWDGGLPALVFGRGRARSVFLAHGGRSQSLAPFRVRRTKLAPAPHQGYSPPLVLGIFSWGVVGRGPSGGTF